MQKIGIFYSQRVIRSERNWELVRRTPSRRHTAPKFATSISILPPHTRLRLKFVTYRLERIGRHLTELWHKGMTEGQRDKVISKLWSQEHL
jgi:hypothetical protein